MQDAYLLVGVLWQPVPMLPICIVTDIMMVWKPIRRGHGGKASCWRCGEGREDGGDSDGVHDIKHEEA